MTEKEFCVRVVTLDDDFGSIKDEDFTSALMGAILDMDELDNVSVKATAVKSEEEHKANKKGTK